MTPVPDPSAAEDLALMLAVKRGDATAFATLVGRWQQPVLYFVHRMLPDREEAEDLAQNVFVQVWRTADRYEPAARVSTFLFAIARNLCLNELRRRRRHPAEALDAPVPGAGTEGDDLGRQFRDPSQAGPDAEVQRAELLDKVDEAVADLPEKQRVALALCRDGELSYEEIATVLGVSVPATKSLIFRAREVLRERLKAYLADGTWAARTSADAGSRGAPGIDGNFSGPAVMHPSGLG